MAKLNYDPRPPERQDVETRGPSKRGLLHWRWNGWLVAAILIGLTIWAVRSSSNDQNVDSAVKRVDGTQLEVARGAVALPAYPWFEIRDGGYTLIVDGEGDESRGANVSEIAELLYELEVPSSVVTQMENTRALDGMVDATWGDLSATWTYHPDDGLDIIITEER